MKYRAPDLGLIGKLLFETIAVVIGVSIAFFVDNWKDSRNEKRNEIALLQAIKSDITSDSLTLVKNIEIINVFIATYDRILTSGFSKDSALFELDRLISYVAYRPIDLSYKEMQQTGASNSIANKNLLYKIITLNDKVIGIIDESIAIDRAFILDRMIPFMEKNAAYPYDQKATGALLKNNEFRNLMRTDMLYKNIDKTALAYYKTYAAQVVKAIDAELEELRN